MTGTVSYACKCTDQFDGANCEKRISELVIIYLAKIKSGAPQFLYMLLCLLYERNNVTNSSSFLELYIS